MLHAHYKLGKKPARPGAVSLKLSKYLDKTVLPKLPAHFGHEDLVKDWMMLGNDAVGDCACAGPAHMTMMWNAEAGRDVRFSDKSVLSDYSAITGYNPADPNTDQGTDMQVQASYWRKTGILDAAGNRHKVGAYLAIEPGDLHEHYLGIRLFGAVGIGIEFPGSAMTQFNQAHPWTVVPGSRIEGGHMVPLVAKRTTISCVTWGRIQGMTVPFFHKYNDESLAYVSEETLTAGKSPEGFDLPTLLADLQALKQAA